MSSLISLGKDDSWVHFVKNRFLLIFGLWRGVDSYLSGGLFFRVFTSLGQNVGPPLEVDFRAIHGSFRKHIVSLLFSQFFAECAQHLAEPARNDRAK